MYRVTFTSLIAVSLLLVCVHSFRDPRLGEDDEPIAQSRFSASSAARTNSQVQMKNSIILKPLRPLGGINTGGAGGSGNAQVQQGDGGRSRTSGGNGGVGGTVSGTGIRNTGGAGGSGNAQIQLGANSHSDTSGGNGAAGGNVIRKRSLAMSSSFNVPSFPSQNIGGRGGDGNAQVQGGGFGAVSGGNGGNGGNVFASASSFPSSFPSGESITNIQNSVSAQKRGFAVSSSFNDVPSFPGQNIGGRGGDGNVQIQGGLSNSVSGGNGGAGGSVSASQPGFPSGQSITNMQSSITAFKRELGSDKNVSRVD